MNVMIAWELGFGLGHLARHVDLAKALVLRGHCVTFVVKDLKLGHGVLSKLGFQYIQAPRVNRHALMDHAICSHADILDNHAMAEASTCMTLLQAWAQLYRILKTEVVVLDHAPGALFAAKCLGVKTIELGTGFYCPPAQTPYPLFRPWENLAPEDLLARETSCLAAMNPFAVQLGCGAFRTLADALKSDVPLLTSFAELDHYPQRIGGRYIGPNHGFTEGEVVDWRGNAKHKVFVYLHHWPELDQLLTQLSRFDVEVIAYCPELTSEQRKKLSSKTLNLIERPVQMAHVLKDCDLMITNGGHGLMTACLLFGVSALVIPLYVEQRLMADCIKRAGVGLGILPNDIPARLESVLESLLTDSTYGISARKLKHKYRNFDLPKTIERLVNTVEGMGGVRPVV